jgi:molybdenum-dependent DNA-binding transcriptional regulator ModE
LSESELKHRYRSATNPIEAPRWQLLWLIALSWTIKEAAAVIGINYDYVKEIVKGCISMIPNPIMVNYL